MPSKLLTIAPGPKRLICYLYYFNFSYSCVSINIYGDLQLQPKCHLPKYHLPK